MDEKEKITKRGFLKRLTGMCGMLLGFGIGKNNPFTFSDSKDEKKTELSPMPMVQLGDHKFSKLILGSNPMSGNSHFSEEMSESMLNYSSEENMIKLMDLSEKNGINTWQIHGVEKFFDMLESHREHGGKMHCIASTSIYKPEEFSDNIKYLMTCNPVAIYIWGEATDIYWRSGKMDVLEDQLKRIRDEGVLVGVASHFHEALEYIDEKNWDFDFYMSCFYNPKRKFDHYPDGRTKPVTEYYSSEYYGDDDRVAMCKFIQQTKKFCFGYKILAASRLAQTPEDARNAFEYAMKNIKKDDAIIVGMLWPYQIKDNCRYVKEICRDLGIL